MEIKREEPRVKLAPNNLILFDFDGTIVEFQFPGIGKSRQFMIDAAHEIKKLGYTIGVWSGRSSRTWSANPEERKLRTQEMIDFLNKVGFPYDIIFGEDCGKVPAIAVIDDTGVPAEKEAVEQLVEKLRRERP